MAHILRAFAGVASQAPIIMLKKFWNRVLTYPAPENPERELFKTVAYGVLFGLCAIPFAPLSSTSPQSAHFLEFPLRVTGSVALSGFYAIGIRLLGPVGRKWAFIATLVMLVVLAFAMVRLLHSMDQLFAFKGGIDDMERATTEAWFVTYGCLSAMVLISGVGWAKWLRSKSGNSAAS